MPLAACQSAPGAGMARRGGDVSLSSPRPPSPITSGALNSCRSPGCLSQGPPGCRVTAPGATSRNPQHPEPRSCRAHPALAPSLRPGTPGWGLRVSAAPGTAASHQPPPSPTRGCSREPRFLPVPRGCWCSARLQKPPALAPKTCSCVRPHVVLTGTWGLTILTYFPGGGLQQGLIH